MRKKNRCVRLLSMVLLFALILCLGACGNGGDEAATTQENETEARLPLVSGREANYVLVRPQNADSALISMVEKIYRTVRSQSGADLYLFDDYIRNGEQPPARPELLIGYTNRPESVAALNAIGYCEWTVRRIGDKIVVAAHTQKLLEQAVNVLVTELLVKDEDGNLTLKEERTVRDESQFEFFFSQNPIESYRIVYPNGKADLKTYAEQMAAILKERAGIEMDVVSDLSPAAEYEILLGVTNRRAFEGCYTGAAAPDSLHYLIRAAGNNILVVGTTDLTASVACERFIADYMENPYSNQFNLPDGLNQMCVAHEADPHSVRAEGVDLRVMSYNILSKNLSPDKLDLSDRRQHVFTTILNYMPDVVGVQEVSERGWPMIEQDLGRWYSCVDHVTTNGEYSYTGMIYNRQTVRLIESKNVNYSTGNKRIRIFTWARFEHLATGKEFIAVSTHWDVQYVNRPGHAQEMTELVNWLRTEYGLPIVCTGDFNSGEKDSYFNTFLDATGQTDARHAAKLVGYESGDSMIDHVTSTSKLETIFYKLLDTPWTRYASDHNPVYADFKFQ